MTGGWTRARVNTVLATITVVAVAGAVLALWLLAAMIGLSRWSR